MRIDSNLPANILAEGTKTRRSQQRRSESHPDEASHSSARASAGEYTAGVLEAAVNQIPDIRLERVNALQQAISEGHYEVDADKVASAMLTDAVLRFGR